MFETFFQREGFEFYEYDQLGSYYSDQPKSTLYYRTICREVEQVRKAIGADSSILCDRQFMGRYSRNGIRFKMKT
jgi:hypothetical protein